MKTMLSMELLSIATDDSADAINAHACLQKFTLNRPYDDLLDLIVARPLAGLNDVRVHIPVNPT